MALKYDQFMTEQPSYSPLSREQALAEVQRQSGYAFDPAVVTALVRHLGKSGMEAVPVVEPAVL